jgi:hypothetical protein
VEEAPLGSPPPLHHPSPSPAPPCATPVPASSLNPNAAPFRSGASSSRPSGELPPWLQFSSSSSSSESEVPPPRAARERNPRSREICRRAIASSRTRVSWQMRVARLLLVSVWIRSTPRGSLVHVPMQTDGSKWSARRARGACGSVWCCFPPRTEARFQRIQLFQRQAHRTLLPQSVTLFTLPRAWAPSAGLPASVVQGYDLPGLSPDRETDSRRALIRGACRCVAVGPPRAAPYKREASRGTGTNVHCAHSAATNPNLRPINRGAEARGLAPPRLCDRRPTARHSPTIDAPSPTGDLHHVFVLIAPRYLLVIPRL